MVSETYRAKKLNPTCSTHNFVKHWLSDFQNPFTVTISKKIRKFPDFSANAVSSVPPSLVQSPNCCTRWYLKTTGQVTLFHLPSNKLLPVP